VICDLEDNQAANMFERFTERARQVVVLAQEEARTLKHNYIGTEHILLGLLREEEGLAARVLESLDITVERVRAQVVRIVGTGEEVTSGQIPFTPRAKKVLELALREAHRLGDNYIDTEHILLSLVRENEGVAARILLDFDADFEKIRNEVIRMLSGPGGRRQGAGADVRTARAPARRSSSPEPALASSTELAAGLAARESAAERASPASAAAPEPAAKPATPHPAAPQPVVFLCHSSKDKEYIRRLDRRLRGDAITTWFDERNLLPGQEWAPAIRAAVRAADVVVVCLSSSSINNAGYVHKEISLVLDVAEEQPDGAIFVIPAKINPCDVPDRLARWHWVDLRKRGGYNRLVAGIRTAAKPG
jgi:hypothetical protein